MLMLMLRRAVLGHAMILALAASPLSSQAPPQVESQKSYTLAFFRLDERGHRRPGDTVTEITNEVKRLRSDGKEVLVVLFVHGWKHDASPTDTNLKSFRAVLKDMAEREHHSRRIVGIYVSWPAKGLFWTRRRIADKVVRSNELTKLLEHLNRTVKPRGAREPLSRLILVGHSFGARVLFESVAQTVTSAVIREGAAREGEEECVGNQVCHPVTGFGDLIVLINPAFEASIYEVFDQYSRGEPIWRGTETLTEIGSHGDPRDAELWDELQLPLILVVGAENDSATARLWPMSSLWLGHPTDRTTLTNYHEYVTHRLECVDSVGLRCACTPPVGSPVSNDMTGDQIRSVLDRTKASSPFGCARLVPLSARGNSPFIVARADTRLIDGHSGIWGREFTAFLEAYVAAFDISRMEQATRPTRRPLPFLP